MDHAIQSTAQPYAGNKPFVRILEQPAPRSLRFRYECEIEGRSAGSIVGINNTPENRTYPTIQVVNYQGPYAVVVSCVTKDGPPYRPHPHNLVGREHCKRGAFTNVIKSPDLTCSFTSLGIQCVKKRDIDKSLKVRKEQKLDPFGTGFTHPNTIDLNVLRLCFQVFLPGSGSSFTVPLDPIVSEPIHDKKAVSDLTIMKLSHYSAPVVGGTEVILLCDRVIKDDIQVWLFEEHDSTMLWESQAEFQPNDVHKQVAISFRIPRYHNENIQHPAPVYIELRKPSENKRGEPRPFQYLPVMRDPEGLARKKQKIDERMDIDRYFTGNVLTSQIIAAEHHIPIGVPRLSRQPPTQPIKSEPPIAYTAACAATSFIPPEFSIPSAMSPISIPTPSPSSQLTPANSPNLAISPGSQHSPTSPAMHPIMHLNIECNANDITVDNAFIEKMDSLELGNINLSASIFDSTPSITEPIYKDDSDQAMHHQQQGLQ